MEMWELREEWLEASPPFLPDEIDAADDAEEM